MRCSLRSTSTRTFVAYPLLLAAAQARSRRRVRWGWSLLLACGYLQYRLAGSYRNRAGGGGPGLHNPPERLVTTGVYALTRNPMYLGHQAFLAGLALMTRSPLAAVLFVVHIPWFDARARADEAGLAARFGQAYEDYRRQVPRWIPRVRALHRPPLDSSRLMVIP